MHVRKVKFEMQKKQAVVIMLKIWFAKTKKKTFANCSAKAFRKTVPN